MPLGKEVGLGSGNIVLDGDQVGTQSPTADPLHFRPMPIVAKRSPISATADVLYKRSPKNRTNRHVCLQIYYIQSSTMYSRGAHRV